MSKKAKSIFAYFFILSVFSLTLQASVLKLSKESKIFKNQSKQSPIAEEEEEKSHDGDESGDEEIVYLHAHQNLFYSNSISFCSLKFFELDYCSSSIEIPIPPPKVF